jgi:hypothetical protein
MAKKKKRAAKKKKEEPKKNTGFWRVVYAIRFNSCRHNFGFWCFY